MLSRFSVAGRPSFKTCVVKFQPVFVRTSSAVPSDNAGKTSNSPASSHPPEYPPPTSKRDFVNFPRFVRKERAPPVRMGFIPETWFQFFYPKTGYTGPYMFLTSGLVYMFSKEILVVDHNFVHLSGFILALTFIHMKFGDKIGEMYNKMYKEKTNVLDGGQELEKQQIRDEIKYLEGMSHMKSVIEEVTKGTTEFVQMQMELAFRERLQSAYKQVKNKLDCQAELENVERRIAQKNLMDYVLTNVLKSITPDLEKKSMQLCIQELNNLSSKA